MNEPLRVLEPLAFPLQGSALIEASAGTGKTYTLALLYLRLVLRHGGAAAFTRPLLPTEILVVTFTRAATRELRDRIRSRLVEAAACFRGERDADSVDPLLHQLRNEVAATEDLQAAARRLDLAAEWMDEAAINTIHAWCYQMLTAHAFDSGHNFVQELSDDEGELQQQVAEDYWRTFYLHLPRAALQRVRRCFDQPRTLADQVRPLLSLVDAVPRPEEAPEALLTRTQQNYDATLQQLKADWQTHLPALTKLFSDASAANQFEKARLRSNHLQGLLDKLQAWLDGAVELPSLDASSATYRRMALLETDYWKDPASIPADNPACLALQALPQQLAALPRPDTELLCHALHWMQDRLQQEKRRLGLLSSDDLLQRLDAALQGPQGEPLAAAIRKQFPVALVDEFQDTDPVQYRIFNCIYQVRQPRPETGFFMIGDPKQAIYAFRGADIHTYLAARRDTADRHYTLQRNFRSTPALIQAVNALFNAGEQREAGAFLFKRDHDNPLPFITVAAGSADRGGLVVGGQPAAPQQAWLLEVNGKRGDYLTLAAQATAGQIADLLQKAQVGQAQIPDESGDGLRPVRPADLAVLVNRGAEATAVRQALFELGIASVYLSDNASVLTSPLAAELLLVLRAMASPQDDRLLRQALGSHLLDRSLDWLDRLNRDAIFYEEQQLLFMDYHHIWQQKGVLAVLGRLLTDFDLGAGLLAQPGGERHLTDLLHLGELLQTAARQLDGEQALLRHLEEALADPETVSESRQQRLESDAELVQVVTVHKSKGLEYSLVFLPYACYLRQAKKTDRPLKTHDEQGLLQVHLQPDDVQVLAADQERLAEDLRKLYVALTRARYGHWLGLAALPDLAETAIGWLLAADDANLAERLQDSGLFTLAEPRLDAEPLLLDAAPQWLPARTVAHQPPENWWVASYSALTYGADSEAPETAAAARRQEVLDEQVTATALPSRRFNPQASLHAFPRGSLYGTFLHGLLEWAGEQGFAAALQQPVALQALLHQRCQAPELQNWVQPLQAWLQQLLTLPLPLPDQPLVLSQVASEQMAVEMEFLIQSRQVDATRLDQLVRQQVLAGGVRPAVEPVCLNGLMKGFMDLVVEHQGRYYVVDWKSNWLGDDDLAYSQSGMQACILQKRYDLQYVLYLLALHRQLQARLPDYDYDRHLGGAVYVFLRGLQSDSRGVFFDRLPRLLIEQLDALFAGRSLPQAQQGQMEMNL